MKNTFYLLIIFGLLISCNKDHNKGILGINILNVNRLVNDKFKDDHVFYAIKISMKNNSDSTLKYWTMTAVWQESWIFNSDKIHFIDRSFENNGPIIKEIQTKKSNIISDTICISKDFFMGKPRYIKIGFIYIKSTKANDFLDAVNLIESSRKSCENIFWSDSIKLSVTNQSL